MLEAELLKDVKKLPFVEYNIPKQIFTIYDVESRESLGDNSVTLNLWDLSID